MVILFCIADILITLFILGFNQNFQWDIINRTSNFNDELMGTDRTIEYILYFFCNFYVYLNYIFLAFIKKKVKINNLKSAQNKDENISLERE